MESLLCNEVWLMSPTLIQENDCACLHATTTKQDCEEAFAAFLAKEETTTYLSHQSNHDFIAHARFKAVSWIIKSQTRMDLHPETVFAAVNYLDRFISLSLCQEWKFWMFELISIACLSIAAKFNETAAYPLHEFQEDLEDSFAPSLIQRMELTVLKALDWRVDSTTPFSYIHLLTQTTSDHASNTNQTLIQHRVTHLLLDALLDPRFLEFPQFVVAISAVKAVLQDSFLSSSAAADYASLAHLETLIPQHHKDDMIRCMEKILMCGSYFSSPSSPVTVLKVDLFSCKEFRTAPTKMDMRWSRKRKREEGEEEVKLIMDEKFN